MSDVQRPIAVAVFAWCAAMSMTGAADTRPAAGVYKNVQVLGDIPADRMVPAMQFISNALGVECGYCHADDGFDKEGKAAKEVARKMMRMQLAINRMNFDGRVAVTCQSCHRGSPRPETRPDIRVAEAIAAAADTREAARPNPPTPVDPILDRYLNAVGGAAAIERIVTRVEHGTISFGGPGTPLDIFTKRAAQRAEVTHRPDGDAIAAYDGRLGWTKNVGAAPLDMSPAAAEYFRFDADLHLPITLKRLFTDWRVESDETLHGRVAHVLVGRNPGVSPASFYFDAQTGLLVRIVRFTETPLGGNPWQIDLDDYRIQDGVSIPFRRELSQFHFVTTVQIERVQQNVPIDDSTFRKPS